MKNINKPTHSNASKVNFNRTLFLNLLNCVQGLYIGMFDTEVITMSASGNVCS